MHNNGITLSTKFSSIPAFLSREHACPLCCRCYDDDVIARTVFCYSRTSRISERPSMRAIPLPTLVFGLLYAKKGCIQPHLARSSEGANAPANLDSSAMRSFSLRCSVIELLSRNRAQQYYFSLFSFQQTKRIQLHKDNEDLENDYPSLAFASMLCCFGHGSRKEAWRQQH